MEYMAAAVTVRFVPSLGTGNAFGSLEARVLQFLHADGHGHVVGTARDRVDSLAQCLRARGAEIFDPGDRLVADAERTRQKHAAHARLGRAEPVGINIRPRDTGRGERPFCSFEYQLVRPEVPQFAELRAGHTDDGRFVGDTVRTHQASPPRQGRAFQK